jgi:uncharacterized delta-60 repeat protein
MFTWIQRKNRPASSRRSTSYCPRLEGLEERAVPAAAGGLNSHYHMAPIAGFIGQNAVAEGPGGQVFLAGNDLANNLLVARLLPNGKADPSFGQGGTATIPLSAIVPNDGSFFGGVGSVAVSSNGQQIVVGGFIGASDGFDQFFAARLTSSGALDPSFNGTGVAIIPGTALLGFGGMALSPSGQVYFAGEEQGPFITTDDYGDGYSPTRLDVARLTPSGQPDATFAPNDPAGIPGVATVLMGTGTQVPTSIGGVDGTAFVPDSYFPGRANGVALTPAGNIVVVGTDLNTVTFAANFAVVQFTAGGQLDPSFGASDTGGLQGMAVVGDGTGADFASDVALDASGRIVVSGSSGASLAVARLNSDGSLDSTFTGGAASGNAPGFITLPPTTGYGIDGSAVSVALEGTGQIVLVSSALDNNTGFGVGFTLAELNSNGSLDLSFGTNNDGVAGVEATVFSQFSNSAASGFVIVPDGNIVVGGLGETSQTADLFAVGYIV